MYYMPLLPLLLLLLLPLQGQGKERQEGWGGRWGQSTAQPLTQVQRPSPT